ncbi:MAG TPA: class I SAM-dependent methyltransferase [Gaiellaceae bacterium]|nr:class I SAM-dependent methyltransferase [Gaiellaceae bacterium]
MNPDELLPALRAAFDDFPESELPRDPRFAEVLEAVGGLATPNTLALVAAAASLVGPGECYVEVGTFKGASLISALVANPGLEAVAIDSFVMGDGSRERLEENLARFGVAGRPAVLEGDVFELVPAGALEGRRIGVWYYDAAHDYESQLRGLQIAEPYLVDGALLVVDDTDWERVESAIRDYLAGQPRARRVLTVEGKDRGRPHWWEGMQVLAWRAV